MSIIDDLIYAPIEGTDVRTVAINGVSFECRLERLDDFDRWWISPKPSDEQAWQLMELLESVA